MEKTKRKITAIFLLQLIGTTTLLAQTSADSLKIVSEALQMIEFADPEFTDPFMPTMTSKAIEDMGFDQPNQSEVVKFEMRDGTEMHGQPRISLNKTKKKTQ